MASVRGRRGGRRSGGGGEREARGTMERDAEAAHCEEQAEGKREIEPNCRSKTDMAGIDS